jgi:DUF4097 and DUF4098 domain-containing protein YvlB
MIGTMIRYVLGSTLVLLALSATAWASDYRNSVEVATGGTLEVDLSSGAIEIETHDKNEVYVEARSSSSRTRFELTSDGTDARLTSSREGLWKIFGWGRVRVEILVPEDYSLDLRTGGGSIEIEGVRGEIVARTSGGRIEVDEVEGNLDIHTSGGSIQLEEIRGDVRARTSGGKIRVSEVTGALEVRTSGGSIRIDDADGPVEAHTSGGSIEVRFSGAPGGVLKTSGGSIDAEFPRDSGIFLDAKTSGGRVQVESEITIKGTMERDHIAGKINGGGPHLELRTSGGNIRVSER